MKNVYDLFHDNYRDFAKKNGKKVLDIFKNYRKQYSRTMKQ